MNQLALFCFVVVYGLCGSIFTLWSTYLINGLSKLAVIQKRYSFITNLVVIFSITLIIVVHLLHCALITFEERIDKLIYTILLVMIEILNEIFFDGILFLIFLRFYMMYFDVNYRISVLEGAWIALLDPNTTKTNWYLNQKEKYGNIRWVALRLLILYLLSISISIAMSLLMHNDIISIILHFIAISVNIYIYNKSPTFYDHYYMRDEMKAINIVCCLYVSAQFAHYLYSLWFVEVTAWITLYIVIQITLISSLCFVSTAWIVSIICNEYGSYNHAVAMDIKPIASNNHEEEEDDDEEEDEIRMPVLVFMHRQKKHLEDIEISQKIKLHRILSANESFTLFMQHLSRESFMACLLSFVEYVQFKQLLADNLIDINRGTFGNAKLAPSIPKSVIVHSSPSNEAYDDQQKLLKEYKCRAYMLYNKYIKDGAEFQLDLPSDYKSALDPQIGELDKWVNSAINSDQLFHIFDNVIFSQYQIMWKSYQRFVKTGDYELVENLFKK
eukprot:110602_1